LEPVLFYGVPQGCSFGSIVALEWLGAPYRLCRVEMPGEVQGAAFARINPVRETPALMLDDGRIVTESAAILAALVARDPAHRLGGAQGTADFDRLNQAMSFLTTTYFAAYSPLWTAYEMAEDPPVQAMLRKLGREQVAKAHGQLEAMLEGRDWLTGDRRTVADAYFAGLVRWAGYHDAGDLAAHPRLSAFVARLEADPAVAFAKAIEGGEEPTGSSGFRGHVALADLVPRLAA
jgi:glutathione S-transferase